MSCQQRERLGGLRRVEDPEPDPGVWGSPQEQQVCELLLSPVKSLEGACEACAPGLESSGQVLLSLHFQGENMMRDVFQPVCCSSKSDFNLLLKRKVTFLVH